jgi:membrane-bound ClpP family serine protease
MASQDPKPKRRYQKKARFWLSLVATIVQATFVVLIGTTVLPALNVHVPWFGVLLVVVGVVGWDVFTYIAGTKALDREPVGHLESMVGLSGKVVDRLAPCGTIQVHGEMWKACSEDGEIQKGEGVKVVSQDRLALQVKRVQTR